MADTKVVGGMWLGLGLALFTALLWGALPLILKLLLSWLDAYTLTWCRFLAAGMLVTPLVARGYGLASPFKIRGTALLLALLCIGGLCANYVSFVSGLSYIPPGTAQIVMQLSPLFVLFGGLVIFKEPFSPLQWGGFVLLVVGMLFFFNQRYADLLLGWENYTKGVLLVLFSAFCWATFMLAQKPLLKLLPSASVLFLVYWSGVFLYFPFIKLEQVRALPTAGMLLLTVSILFTLTSYLSFAESLKRMETSRLSALLGLPPLITVGLVALLAMVEPGLIEREQLNGLALVGAVLVVVGSMCTSLGKKRKV